MYRAIAYIRNKHLEIAYRKLLREFLENSTLHGMKIFLYRTALSHARQLWLLCMAILIVWTHYVIIHLTVNYVEQPTEIHMSTNLMHVSNSPFPGLAICSGNKFSKQKMLAYAEKVFKAQQKYWPNLLANSSARMAEELLILAGLYVFPFDNYNIRDDRPVKLHNILTRMYNEGVRNSTEYTYPSRDILRDLGPDCDSLTIRAFVFGKPVNASDIFYKRITSTSVCCMYNYRRLSYSEDISTRTYDNEIANKSRQIKYESSSVLNSVTFVLQSNPEDFTYKEMSNNAFQLYIFPPDDYATIQSNSAGEIFVDHNTIVEIPIQPKFFESSNSIRAFPPSVRYCYFPEEGQKILNKSYYSIDECLLICRMRSQMKYCGCVNPTLPAPLINASYCNLLDIACLTRWKTIWYGWHDFDHLHESNSDKENIDNCVHCLPTCDLVSYTIHVNTLHLRNAIGGNYSFGILKGLSNRRPLAVVKFFFQHLYEQANENVIVDDWIDLLNRFGGIMSLMYGFSFISAVEIFYFFTGKWLTFFRHMRKINEQQRNIEDNTSVYQLYWKELQPKHFLKFAKKYSKQVNKSQKSYK